MFAMVEGVISKAAQPGNAARCVPRLALLPIPSPAFGRRRRSHARGLMAGQSIGNLRRRIMAGRSAGGLAGRATGLGRADPPIADDLGRRRRRIGLGDGGECEAVESNPMCPEEGASPALAGRCRGASWDRVAARPGDGGECETVQSNPMCREDGACPALAGRCLGASRDRVAARPGDGGECEAVQSNPMCREDGARLALAARPGDGGKCEAVASNPICREDGTRPCMP